MRFYLSSRRYYLGTQSVSIRVGSSRVGPRARAGKGPGGWTITLSSDGGDHACLPRTALNVRLYDAFVPVRELNPKQRQMVASHHRPYRT